MPDLLNRILAVKRAEISAACRLQDLASLRREVESAPAAERRTRGFHDSLRRKIAAGQSGVIAEIKRAAPSAGLLQPDFQPDALAASYAGHGAACLSVLTDAQFFGGTPGDLRKARTACALPVLRKDFIISPYQVYQARAWGADCILLIVAALDPALMADLECLAHALGMDVLVEAHDRQELDAALRLRTRLIGINNRNLRTLATSVQTTIDLRSSIPPDRLLVTESGIRTPGDVSLLRDAGVHAYLVGAAFLRTPDPGAEMARLFG
jgi:indole-3-glycerol phosphate synthase